VDKATKGKYHDQIENVSTKLGDALNRVSHPDQGQGPGTPKPGPDTPKPGPEAPKQP
jgi:hypothetical protein